MLAGFKTRGVYKQAGGVYTSWYAGGFMGLAKIYFRYFYKYYYFLIYFI